ncbi:MAG: hypothetical protein IPP48_16140 [Chitinophagaceae bacterium]|nr:hypothetical protein [Chitinophagaceae bacterium]
MKKVFTFVIIAMSFAILTPTLNSCKNNQNEANELFEEENEGYDGADQAVKFEIERTKNPATGKVPWEKLRLAIAQTEELKNSSNSFVSALNWIERGPNGDFTVGGNPRPNNDQTAGRIRAAMVDSLDATHKTVWVGGVDGGLWKTTDITLFPATWTLVNDNLANLSYFCNLPRSKTGVSKYNVFLYRRIL